MPNEFNNDEFKEETSIENTTENTDTPVVPVIEFEPLGEEPEELPSVNEETTEQAIIRERKEYAHSVLLNHQSWAILRGEFKELGVDENATPADFVGKLIDNRKKLLAPDQAATTPPTTPETAQAATETPEKEAEPIVYAYQPPKKEINWQLIAAIVGGVLVLALVIWLVFKYGKKLGAKGPLSIVATTATTAGQAAKTATEGVKLFDLVS